MAACAPRWLRDAELSTPEAGLSEGLLLLSEGARLRAARAPCRPGRLRRQCAHGSLRSVERADRARAALDRSGDRDRARRAARGDAWTGTAADLVCHRQ